MTMTEPLAIRIHEDTDLFREAVNLTAADTKFAARLSIACGPRLLA
jgi:hypothetical protein